MERLKKITILSVKGLLFFLILLFSYQYFQVKYYEFPTPKPFSGSTWYNPYDSLEHRWYKSNFHTHAHAWNGITNGHQSGDEVLTAYRQLGYDLPCISDYFSINEHLNKKSETFIPVYEHGINIHKSHRQAIGSEKICFYDVSLFQNLDIRQYLIERVKQTSPVVAINHPGMRGSHPLEMMPYLSGYDLLEVINSFRVATEHWDAALSAGHPVWLLANDDCHDIERNDKLAKAWTMVHAQSMRSPDVLEALKRGKSYGVQRKNGALSKIKMLSLKWFIKQQPILKKLTVENDSIKLSLSQSMSSIRLIGQQGKILTTATNTNRLFYPLKNDDTYVRIEAEDAELLYFLNPIIRYDDTAIPANHMEARMLPWKTFYWRIGIVMLDLILIYLLYATFWERLLLPRKRMKWISVKV